MPEDKKVEKEEEKEESSEVTETEDGGVEVSVEEETPKGEEKKKEEKPESEKSWRNKVYAQDRIVNRLQKEIDELKTKVKEEPSSQEKTKAVSELDEIDKLAQSDWKSAVRKLASVEARNIIQAERKNLEEQKSQEEVSILMEKNSESVLAKHSELNDTESEKSQIFQEILNKNPRWRTSPDGPLLTMYEMESELRKRGYDVDGVIKDKVESERERVVKANASSLPSSHSKASSGKIVLTREQREFCDLNGVSYEDYARTLKRADNVGGIEV